jgi:hypothetical protein
VEVDMDELSLADVEYDDQQVKSKQEPTFALRLYSLLILSLR